MLWLKGPSRTKRIGSANLQMKEGRVQDQVKQPGGGGKMAKL